MDEEELSEASRNANLSGTEPEDAQHSGQCGKAKAQVCEGKHGQEIVHGFMEGGISMDDMEDSEVPKNNCQVDGAEGNRDPAMEIFQTLKSSQKESHFLKTAVVRKGHVFTILDSPTCDTE